jgi:hypothetical protein
MKNKILALAAAALAVSGAVSAPAFAGQSVAEKGEAKLAMLLEGRVAGEPVRCISGWNSSKLQVIDETALVYDAGSTVYVARPTDPKVLDRNDILVTKRTGSQLCANDTMHMVDSHAHFVTGVVFLDNFVPYKKQG